MLQAHSILWHYLWLAPHILQLLLAALLIRRGLHRRFPIFLAYLLFESVEELILYALDIAPSVGWQTFWGTFFGALILEALLKFAVVGELFLNLARPWPTLARVGNRLVSGIGVVLVLLAALAAGLTLPDNTHWVISGAHTLEQTLYIIQAGLVLFLFLFAAYFKLAWNTQTFGIALGFGILSCEHLATWAVMAGSVSLENRVRLDLLNMATYHLCVLIWSYYLLIPQKVVTTPAVPLPENSLELWNRELERLLQQ